MHLCDTQEESQQLASKHKEERSQLLADLEARTAALTATQATVAEREAAHASLQQHCKELQVGTPSERTSTTCCKCKVARLSLLDGFSDQFHSDFAASF